MDSETLNLLLIVVGGISGTIFALLVVFMILRRMGGGEDTWELRTRGRPLPASGTFESEESRIGPMQWPGTTENKLDQEIEQIEQGGYQAYLVPLEKPNSYCVRVSGSLPTKERTAYLYLVCEEFFPVSSPTVYAEVLSASRIDSYGQAKPREVELGPLQTVAEWNADSDLLGVVREAFGELDESYRPTGQISVFFNEYGEWVRPTS
jgi:hypothetical protein